MAVHKMKRKKYSDELVILYAGGATIKELMAHFELSKSSIYRAVKTHVYKSE